MPVSAPVRAVTRRINTILRQSLSGTISPCPVTAPHLIQPTRTIYTGVRDLLTGDIIGWADYRPVYFFASVPSTHSSV